MKACGAELREEAFSFTHEAQNKMWPSPEACPGRAQAVPVPPLSPEPPLAPGAVLVATSRAAVGSRAPAETLCEIYSWGKDEKGVGGNVFPEFVCCFLLARQIM